jgi:hypothetical protein
MTKLIAALIGLILTLLQFISTKFQFLLCKFNLLTALIGFRDGSEGPLQFAADALNGYDMQRIGHVPVRLNGW